MRLFVAFDLPDDIRQRLVRLIAKLEPASRDAQSKVRWVQPESLHITLKFIGHITDEQLPGVRAALIAIRPREPVDLHYRGIGFFPNPRRPRVLWCGVDASPHLVKLAAEIESALEPLGVTRESREFVPHLTLARLGRSAQPSNLARAVESLKDQDFGNTRETKFHLYESILKPHGSQYKKLETYSFVEEGEP
jgi:RNA 2',3'-cyclic 3'-phosphodiesterase